MSIDDNHDHAGRHKSFLLAGVMAAPNCSWALSAILLAAFGVALIGIGLFFIVLRPALLPEDVRFIGLSLEQLLAERPQMASWLQRVFQVLGGYALATGVLMITLAATSFRRHEWTAFAGMAIAGAVSIGWMVVVNFAIASDFRWALLAIALIWVLSAVLFIRERQQATGQGDQDFKDNASQIVHR